MATNISAAQERLNQLNTKENKSSGGGRIKYLKLQEGTNVIRIVPPKAPRETFWIERKRSFEVGPNKKMIWVPSQDGLPDPLMDEINRLKALGDAASKKRADRMYPKTRVILWAVVREVNGKKTDADGNAHESYGPQLFETNLQVLRDILAIVADPDYGAIDDAEKGFDLKIVYTPKEKTSNGFPEWKILPSRNPSPLGDPAWIAEDLFDKYSIAKASDPDYIRACLEGTEESWLAERKAAYEAGRQDEQDSSEIEEKPQPAPANLGSEQSAIERQLAEIRAKKAALAGGAPPPPPATTSVAPPPPPTSSPEESYWAVVNGETKKLSKAELVAQVYTNPNLQAMTLDQTSGWKLASLLLNLGPPAPPKAPTVAADLEAALK